MSSASVPCTKTVWLSWTFRKLWLCLFVFLLYFNQLKNCTCILKWPYLEHSYLRWNACKRHQTVFKKLKSLRSPDNSLSLCLAISHLFPCLFWLFVITVIVILCLISWRFPCLLLPLFVSPKPLMLSVVNGLASCFKAAIAECKFWLLRFIYILVSWSLLYIWVVAMGWHNVNKK